MNGILRAATPAKRPPGSVRMNSLLVCSVSTDHDCSKAVTSQRRNRRLEANYDNPIKGALKRKSLNLEECGHEIRNEFH